MLSRLKIKNETNKKVKTRITKMKNLTILKVQIAKDLLPANSLSIQSTTEW
jgi:hypothetical protein